MEQTSWKVLCEAQNSLAFACISLHFARRYKVLVISFFSIWNYLGRSSASFRYAITCTSSSDFFCFCLSWPLVVSPGFCSSVSQFTNSFPLIFGSTLKKSAFSDVVLSNGVALSGPWKTSHGWVYWWRNEWSVKFDTDLSIHSCFHKISEDISFSNIH